MAFFSTPNSSLFPSAPHPTPEGTLVPASKPRTDRRTPILNPYDKFTQPQFDDWITGLTSSLRQALGHLDEPASRPERTYELDTPSRSQSHLENASEEDYDPEADDSLHELKARRAAAKGKARDPREGPGLGVGTAQEPIYLASDSEDSDSDQRAATNNASDSEQEKSDFDDEEQDQEEEGEEEEEEEEEHEGHLSHVRGGSRYARAVTAEEAYEEDEEEEQEGSSSDRDEEEGDEVIEVDLDSDQEEYENDENTAPPQRSREYEEDHSRAVTVPRAAGRSGRGWVPNVFLDDGENDEDEYSEDDYDQPEEENTAFPPRSLHQRDEQEDIEIADHWEGVNTYAEDFYTGGDGFIKRQHISADRLGPDDHSDNGMVGFLTPGIQTPADMGTPIMSVNEFTAEDEAEMAEERIPNGTRGSTSPLPASSPPRRSPSIISVDGDDEEVEEEQKEHDEHSQEEERDHEELVEGSFGEESPRSNPVTQLPPVVRALEMSPVSDHGQANDHSDEEDLVYPDEESPLQPLRDWTEARGNEEEVNESFEEEDDDDIREIPPVDADSNTLFPPDIEEAKADADSDLDREGQRNEDEGITTGDGEGEAQTSTHISPVIEVQVAEGIDPSSEAQATELLPPTNFPHPDEHHSPAVEEAITEATTQAFEVQPAANTHEISEATASPTIPVQDEPTILHDDTEGAEESILPGADDQEFDELAFDDEASVSDEENVMDVDVQEIQPNTVTTEISDEVDELEGDDSVEVIEVDDDIRSSSPIQAEESTMLSPSIEVIDSRPENMSVDSAQPSVELDTESDDLERNESELEQDELQDDVEEEIDPEPTHAAPSEVLEVEDDNTGREDHGDDSQQPQSEPELQVDDDPLPSEDTPRSDAPGPLESSTPHEVDQLLPVEVNDDAQIVVVDATPGPDALEDPTVDLQAEMSPQHLVEPTLPSESETPAALSDEPKAHSLHIDPETSLPALDSDAPQDVMPDTDLESPMLFENAEYRDLAEQLNGHHNEEPSPVADTDATPTKPTTVQEDLVNGVTPGDSNTTIEADQRHTDTTDISQVEEPLSSDTEPTGEGIYKDTPPFTLPSLTQTEVGVPDAQADFYPAMQEPGQDRYEVNSDDGIEIIEPPTVEEAVAVVPASETDAVNAGYSVIPDPIGLNDIHAPQPTSWADHGKSPEPPLAHENTDQQSPFGYELLPILQEGVLPPGTAWDNHLFEPDVGSSFEAAMLVGAASMPGGGPSEPQPMFSHAPLDAVGTESPESPFTFTQEARGSGEYDTHVVPQLFIPIVADPILSSDPYPYSLSTPGVEHSQEASEVHFDDGNDPDLSMSSSSTLEKAQADEAEPISQTTEGTNKSLDQANVGALLTNKDVLISQGGPQSSTSHSEAGDLDAFVDTIDVPANDGHHVMNSSQDDDIEDFLRDLDGDLVHGVSFSDQDEEAAEVAASFLNGPEEEEDRFNVKEKKQESLQNLDEEDVNSQEASSLAPAPTTPNGKGRTDKRQKRVADDDDEYVEKEDDKDSLFSVSPTPAKKRKRNAKQSSKLNGNGSSTTEKRKAEESSNQAAGTHSDSASSSGASTADRLLLPESRESSPESNVNEGLTLPPAILSPTVPQRPYAPPLLHVHSNSRAVPRHHHGPPPVAQPRNPVPPPDQSFQRPTPPPRSQSLQRPSQSPSTSTARHALEDSVANPSPQRTTRSNCRYHRISLPRVEEGARVSFLVPGCSLVDTELMEEEEIEDHGEATHEHAARMIRDIENNEFTSYLIGILRQLVGVDLLREQEVYYLPMPDEEPVPRKHFRQKHAAKRLSRGESGSYPGSPTSSTRSPVSSRPPVSVAGSTSTIRLKEDERDYSLALSGDESEDGSPRAKKARLSPIVEDTVDDNAHPGSSASPGKKKGRKSKLHPDAAAYKPGKGEESDSEEEPDSAQKKRKSVGGKRGMKRSRTSEGKSGEDSRKPKKIKRASTSTSIPADTDNS